MTPLRIAALAASLALGLGALAACGDDVANGLTERAIENAAGEDVDIDTDGDGNVSITTDEGSLSTTVGELPAGFPDIPLLDGEILSAVGLDQGDDSGWSVTMIADGDAEQLLDQAVVLLEDAGFTADETSRIPGLVAAQVSNGEYDVFVSALESDGVNLTYTVAPVQG